jgi:hypothetical protein
MADLIDRMRSRPSSGAGGRRFESSRSDQSNQPLTEIIAGGASKIAQPCAQFGEVKARKSRSKRLPRHIYKEATRHGRIVVYFRRKKGPRIRLPDDTSSDEFRAAYQSAIGSVPIKRRKPRRFYNIPQKDRMERTIRSAFRASRARAKRKGVPFGLTLDFLLGMACDQEFRCALTGIEFYASNDCKGSRVDPYMPSIDRIVPKLGYVPGNVRLVVYAVNAMILDWGEEMFEQIVAAYRLVAPQRRMEAHSLRAETG